jgi:hypothetical protein
MRMKRKVLTALGLASIVGASAVAAIGASASDHLDAPAVKTDGRTDINDLYVFQSPSNTANTVLVMTVNPGAGVISGTTLDPKSRYRFNIDNDGDANADKVIQLEFGKVKSDGSQTVEVENETGATRFRGKGKVGEQVTLDTGGKLMVGTFDDPFFFDLDGFRHNFQFTGVDFFAGLNTTAIVLEVPSSQLGSGQIGVWLSTKRDGEKIDQMGRPAINTALIAPDRKDAFNQTSPSKQRSRFGPEVIARITALSGDATYAAAIADVLLPDVLTFTVGNPAGFLNGRKLADDVIDAELSLLTKGALVTDGVNANDKPFSNVFPYLAPKN